MDENVDEMKIGEELKDIDFYSQKESKSEKRNFKIELILIFTLGVLLGMVVKTEAAKKVTMGFNDYKVVPLMSDYNFRAIEKKLIQREKNNEEVSENQ